MAEAIIAVDRAHEDQSGAGGEPLAARADASMAGRRPGASPLVLGRAGTFAVDGAR